MDASKRYEKFEKDFFKEWVHRHPLLGTALGLRLGSPRCPADDHSRNAPLGDDGGG